MNAYLDTHQQEPTSLIIENKRRGLEGWRQRHLAKPNFIPILNLTSNVTCRPPQQSFNVQKQIIGVCVCVCVHVCVCVWGRGV